MAQETPMSEDEEEPEQTEIAPLTYQISKTMKVNDLREKMRIRGMNARGPKRTLLKRIAYFTSTKKRRLTQMNQDERTSINTKKNQYKVQKPPKKKQRIQNNTSISFDDIQSPTPSESADALSKLALSNFPSDQTLYLSAKTRGNTSTNPDIKPTKRTIDDLSNDCIQLILSYTLDHAVIFVCKQWNKISKLNTRAVLQTTEKIIAKYSSLFQMEQSFTSLVTSCLCIIYCYHFIRMTFICQRIMIHGVSI